MFILPAFLALIEDAAAHHLVLYHALNVVFGPDLFRGMFFAKKICKKIRHAEDSYT
jgi:hypothetical protein